MAGNANAMEPMIERIHDVGRTITSNRAKWIASIKVGDVVEVSMSRYFAFGEVVAIKNKHFRIKSSDQHEYWIHGKRLRRGKGYSY
jgi:translation initiation factor IF-1